MAEKSSQDDKELFNFAKTELKKLQRQYIIMENDKKSYSTEIKSYICKQRQIIKTLEKEYKELHLKLSTSSENESEENRQISKGLISLIEKYEMINERIKTKKEKIKNLNSKIEQMTMNLNTSKPAILMEIDVLSDKLPKKVDTARNKLHTATIKYNNVLLENSVLRTRVNALLLDRTRFNHLYKKFVTKLNALKKNCLDLIEQATTACDERTELEAKLKAMIEKDQYSRIAHYHEMKDMQRRLNYLMQLQEFFSIKGQCRIMADLELKEAEKRREKLKAREEVIKRDECILEEIKAFTGEENVEKLSALFADQEEENFALFNYVNEIQNEVEMLQEEVKTLYIAIDQCKMSSKSQSETHLDEKDYLIKELERWNNLVEAEKQKYQSTSDNVALVFKCLEQLFVATRCDNAPILQLAGYDSVSFDNMDLFLNIIDEKINQIAVDSSKTHVSNDFNK